MKCVLELAKLRFYEIVFLFAAPSDKKGDAGAGATTNFEFVSMLNRLISKLLIEILSLSNSTCNQCYNLKRIHLKDDSYK